VELFRSLAVFAEPPAPEHARLAALLGLPRAPRAEEYADLFEFALPPYASVYLGEEGMIGGEAQDRVAGVWRVLKQTPPAHPDHLPVLLGLYASLADGEAAERDEARRALWREARRGLLWEHLICWLLPYLDKLDMVGPEVYRAWGRLLSRALRLELDDLGGQAAPPLHCRLAPPLSHPGDPGGLDGFLGALLAPVRSGVLLTRADLARMAIQLRLGLRVGTRRFVLPTLLRQDPVSVLAWLGDEAEASAARHRAIGRVAPAVGQFWVDRAETTARILRAAQAEAGAATAAPPP
jgi:TorA maturation chaperone TorD